MGQRVIWALKKCDYSETERQTRSLWDNNRTVTCKHITATWRVTKACQYSSFKRASLCFFRVWKEVSMRWHVRSHLFCSCCAGSRCLQLPWLSTLSMYYTKCCFHSNLLLSPHWAKSSLLYWYKEIYAWMWYYKKNKLHFKVLFLILEIILNWFQNLFTQSVQLNGKLFFFKTLKLTITFYFTSMTMHNFSNCAQNCVTVIDRRIFYANLCVIKKFVLAH